MQSSDERDRPRTEAERRTAQAEEQREAERQRAAQQRERASVEGRTAGQQYVAVCRVVSGAPGKDRIVIEPETVFDPTVRETELSQEEIDSLLGHGAIRPVEQTDEAAPPPPPPTGEGQASPPNSPADDGTISRDEPR